jgi:hypothetical protein
MDPQAGKRRQAWGLAQDTKRWRGPRFGAGQQVTNWRLTKGLIAIAALSQLVGILSWAQSRASASIAGGATYAESLDGAQRKFKPRITLRVYNYPRLDPSVLAESESVASAILQQAGVEAEWLDCALSMTEYEKYPACHREMSLTDFVLRVLTRSMALNIPTNDEPLGFARGAQSRNVRAPSTSSIIVWMN